MDAQPHGTEPADLAAALDAVPAARGHWDGFPADVRHAVLDWLARAPAGAVRQRRIAMVVRDAERAVGSPWTRAAVRRSNTVRHGQT
jgi:uncharacterized protein YdeI (YjbR/CyaY-like superfamily)